MWVHYRRSKKAFYRELRSTFLESATLLKVGNNAGNVAVLPTHLPARFRKLALGIHAQESVRARPSRSPKSRGELRGGAIARGGPLHPDVGGRFRLLDPNTTCSGRRSAALLLHTTVSRSRHRRVSFPMMPILLRCAMIYCAYSCEGCGFVPSPSSCQPQLLVLSISNSSGLS